jgi:hypothetical protein
VNKVEQVAMSALTADRPTDQALLQELSGWTCRCGRGKPPRSTFCNRCYFRLPEHLRLSLYKPIGKGYGESYAAAVEFLKAEEQTRKALR